MIKTTISNLLIAFLFFVVQGCENHERSTNTHQNTNDVSTILETRDSALPVNYEILRSPTGGKGVFDPSYIIYVSSSISNDQAKWIFDDMIRKEGSQIAIDIWNNKHAFYEELKIYQKEDAIYDAGGDLKKFVKQIDKVTAKYDKYNIAQYLNNGSEVIVTLPDGTTTEK